MLTSHLGSFLSLHSCPSVRLIRLPSELPHPSRLECPIGFWRSSKCGPRPVCLGRNPPRRPSRSWPFPRQRAGCCPSAAGVGPRALGFHLEHHPDTVSKSVRHKSPPHGATHWT